MGRNSLLILKVITCAVVDRFSTDNSTNNATTNQLAVYLFIISKWRARGTRRRDGEAPKAPRGLGVESGCHLPSWRGAWREGHVSSPEIFL